MKEISGWLNSCTTKNIQCVCRLRVQCAFEQKFQLKRQNVLPIKQWANGSLKPGMYNVSNHASCLSDGDTRITSKICICKQGLS